MFDKHYKYLKSDKLWTFVCFVKR